MPHTPLHREDENTFGVKLPQLSPGLSIPPIAGALGQGVQATPGAPPIAQALGQGGPAQPPGPSQTPQPPGSPEEGAQRAQGWAAFLQKLAQPDISQSLLAAGAEILQPREAGTSQASAIVSGLSTGANTLRTLSDDRETRSLREREVASRESLQGAQTGLAEAQTGAIPEQTAADTARGEAAAKVAEAQGRSAEATFMRAQAEQSLLPFRKALLEAQTSDAKASAATRGSGVLTGEERILKQLAQNLLRTGQASTPEIAQLRAFEIRETIKSSKPLSEYKLEILTIGQKMKADIILNATPEEAVKQTQAVDAQLNALITEHEQFLEGGSLTSDLTGRANPPRTEPGGGVRASPTTPPVGSPSQGTAPPDTASLLKAKGRGNAVQRREADGSISAWTIDEQGNPVRLQ